MIWVSSSRRESGIMNKPILAQLKTFHKYPNTKMSIFRWKFSRVEWSRKIVFPSWFIPRVTRALTPTKGNWQGGWSEHQQTEKPSSSGELKGSLVWEEFLLLLFSIAGFDTRIEIETILQAYFKTNFFLISGLIFSKKASQIFLNHFSRESHFSRQEREYFPSNFVFEMRTSLGPPLILCQIAHKPCYII